MLMKRVLAGGLVLGLALVTHTAHARWTIQIGAFGSDFDRSFSAAASVIGEVREERRDDGSVAVVVGQWNRVADARDSLAALSVNYPDAFIRASNPGAATGASASSTRSAARTRDSGTPRDSELLNQLSADERANVVLLDGALHYKSGDTFTPLREWMNQR